MNLRVGLVGLGTGGRSLPLAVARTSGFKFVAGAELEDFYKSVTEDRPVQYDGKWGKATLEVCLAILQSSQNQREQLVVHQVPNP